MGDGVGLAEATGQSPRRATLTATERKSRERLLPRKVEDEGGWLTSVCCEVGGEEDEAGRSRRGHLSEILIRVEPPLGLTVRTGPIWCVDTTDWPATGLRTEETATNRERSTRACHVGCNISVIAIDD